MQVDGTWCTFPSPDSHELPVSHLDQCFNVDDRGLLRAVLKVGLVNETVVCEQRIHQARHRHPEALLNGIFRKALCFFHEVQGTLDLVVDLRRACKERHCMGGHLHG
jgi:hypothetical protein